MGKGDRKSRKGKIFRESFGKTRPRKSTLRKAKVVAAKAAAAAAPKKAAAKKKKEA
jgi:30S ribosomal protein S31